ncbi:Serine/threonine protein kinase [Nannocystis exedens]|uniref:Serine/threonine protein kinase n=1 Tax=Nannocystis exedens TaxID=54 RepID=A0A1I2DPR5_9BACT|nr:serine/threonine-protein kinase [Nannocystis exedens]PCC68998.1 Serine/threonine-protein kinase PknB [Nannocystis exedens]SFE82516.1 Serine/threonine protein kinase [Nannocystis exedens]
MSRRTADPDERPGCEVVGPQDPTLVATLETPPRRRSRSPWPPSEAPSAGETRYVFGEVFAAGGLGVVRRAHDRRLGRVVAIKELLRDSPDAQRRFAREAAITARLQHPSIVPLYDLGRRATGEPFYCMKLVDGASLDAKIRQARDLGERLRLIEHVIAVADAIAYAHDQKVLHRDLKPANVLIGRFGETVVIDWGLAKDLAQPGDSEAEQTTCSGQRSRTDEDLTEVGAIVGTLRYMPPEQARGEPVDARSDVYALGALLYHVLAGCPPFAEASGPALAARVMAADLGDLRERVPGVPRELAAIAHRATAARPELRYPSAANFAEDLRRFQAGRMVSAHSYTLAERLQRWMRRQRVLLAFAGLGATASFFAFKAHEAGLDHCSGGAADIAAAWDAPQRRAAADNFIAAGPAFAAEVWPRVATTLDAYASAWAAQHHEACLTHRRGEQSDHLFDRRMACLAERKAALVEAATLLGERDPEVSLHALELVGGLPPLARCSDVAALDAAVPPPGDPEAAVRVAAVRDGLVKVAALDRVARTPAALALADALVREAEAIGHAPTLAEALLRRGELRLHDDADDAAARLQLAQLTAVRAGADEIAAEAAALLVFVRGRQAGGIERGLAELPMAEALVARLPPHDRLRGLFLNNAAVLARSTGDLERARRLLDEALGVQRAAPGPARVEVAYTLTNLAMLVEEPGPRELALREALAILERELGPAHARTIELRVLVSLYTLDPRVAHALLRPGCDALERFSPGASPVRARCLVHLAHHADEAGDEHAATALRVRALGLIDPRSTLVEDIVVRAHLDLVRGAHDDAVVRLRGVLRSDLADDTWWVRERRAGVLLLLGLHLRARGELAAARTALQGAIDDFVAVAATASSVVSDQQLARARVAHAELALAGPPDPEGQARALRDLDEADRWYAAAGEAYAWRRHQVAALRGRLTGAG